MRTDSLEETISKNQALFDEKYGQRLAQLRSCIDAQHSYSRLFFGFLGSTDFTNHANAGAPLASAVVKNELALFASASLVRDGLYGVATMQLRSVFEALMIGKVASLLRSDPVIERWEKGDSINFSRGVLKRIKSPQVPELKELWSGLCKTSHATIYSFQVETDYENIREEISGTLAIIEMLLSCNFHLINRHFVTKTLFYYATRYGDEEQVKNKREAARNATKELSCMLSQKGNVLIREYSRAWEVA